MVTKRNELEIDIRLDDKLSDINMKVKHIYQELLTDVLLNTLLSELKKDKNCKHTATILGGHYKNKYKKSFKGVHLYRYVYPYYEISIGVIIVFGALDNSWYEITVENYKEAETIEKECYSLKEVISYVKKKMHS